MSQQTRFYGLDLIRLISFLAIAVFHISVIHFHSNHLDIGDRSIIILAIESFARSISFSGFTILFLSSLLTGLSGSTLAKRVKLFLFLFIGWVALCYLIHAKVNFLKTWDVYLLILLGLSTASIAEHISKKAIRFLTILGFVLLWIPFWEIGDFVENSFGLPIPWQSVLGLANCPISFSEWPILPWIGLIWFGYGIGIEIKALRQIGATDSLRLTKPEIAVWFVLLACSTINWGAYYNIKLVEFFRCQAYKMPPFVFWSHLIWPMALIRASIDDRVQAWLGRYRLIRWVTNLAISRHFWLAYATHYILALFLSFLVNASKVESTFLYDYVVIFIALTFVPMTEYTIRIIRALYMKAKKRFLKEPVVASSDD